MKPSPVGRARLIFGFAGIYGLVVLTPFFFLEPMIARATPAGLSHPEYYYGFLGGAWVMQLVYLCIARDPVRHRPLMPICVLAKIAFFMPVLLLWLQQRAATATLAFASIDLLIAVAFAFAWRRTPS